MFEMQAASMDHFGKRTQHNPKRQPAVVAERSRAVSQIQVVRLPQVPSLIPAQGR